MRDAGVTSYLLVSTFLRFLKWSFSQGITISTAILFCPPYFFMWKIVSSPFGLCLKATRDNPEKAEYLGINVKKYRWYAFIISGAYASIGGALLAPAIGQVDPGLTYWTHSGTLVFMTLLGVSKTFSDL